VRHLPAAEPTGSFSAIGHGPSLSGHLYQFNWYIRYNDGTEKTVGVPIWSDARRRKGHNRGELENMRVVSALSGDNQAAATLETTDRKLHVIVRAMVLEAPAATVEFTLANTAQDTIEQVELSVLVNIDAGPRSTRLDCSVVDSGEPPSGLHHLPATKSLGPVSSDAGFLKKAS
jgi:hypothetical protein